jgi:hypothetical protein
MEHHDIFSRLGLDAMGFAPGTPSFHLHRPLQLPYQPLQRGQAVNHTPSPANTSASDARDNKSDRQFRDWSVGHGDKEGEKERLTETKTLRAGNNP